jgi:hypothetical protein
MHGPPSAGQECRQVGNEVSLRAEETEKTLAGTEKLSAGDHAVQFYDHDEELAGRVAGYLAGSLRRGGVAIAIATPAHCHAVQDRLRQAGLDLAQADYRALDAAGTARALMAGGRLDQAAFDRVLGEPVRRAGAGGRPVRAYGEIVALLWDQGLVKEVVQLEEMWDELSRGQPWFSLSCGYPAAPVTRDGHLDAFAAVCRLHRQVTGLACSEAVRAFGYSRDAPAQARHFAVGVLDGWGAGHLSDDVALVVTELAANAIVHACSGFTVTLAARGGLLRISAAVDALASRWGVESHGDAGKAVWVELRR